MKKLLSIMLVLAMGVSMLAGCGAKDTSGLDAAAEYVYTLYKDVDAASYSKDYEVVSVVKVGTETYNVVWSTDADEANVKVVAGEKMTTIDVNEDNTEEVIYTLTATVSDKDGNTKSVSFSRRTPAAVKISATMTYAELVEMAYALEQGVTMDTACRLFGEIVKIDTEWSDDYGNITVSIVVEGAEDKPIMCYRLKGEGAKDLKVGDKITVEGYFTNYNGTIEFAAGCQLLAVGKEVLNMAAIVEAAYKLEPGMAMEDPCTLQGLITKVDTAWSDEYKNITVTIEVEGAKGKPIMCYRLADGDAKAKDLKVGDLITVTGILKNYEGTIEFDAGCKLDAVTTAEELAAMTEKPDDERLIVDAAYALKTGKSLPWEATLTGVISAVNTPWNDQYGNITVTIKVAGRESKPIMCYRLAGKGAEGLNVNDTITVTGTLTNYNGLIQFAQGCTVDKIVKGEAPKAPSSAAAIVDAAYKLKDGEALPYEAQLTGVVTKINFSYNPTYGDASITIKVLGKEFYCFYLSGKGVEDVAVGDTVTVKGVIKNYQGTIEFDHPTLVKREAAPVVEAPSDKLAIIDAAYALKDGEYLPYEATLTGVISKVDTKYDSGYKNVTVTIKVAGREDKPIMCYRLKGTGADVIGVGDTITVTGKIKNYKGTIEFDSGCTLDSYTKTEGVEPDTEEPGTEEPGTEEPGTDETVDLTPGLDVETGYKYFINQVTLGKVLYFNGELTDKEYLATTEDITAAVDVYVEEVTDGARFYFMKDGVKTYIEIYKNTANKIRFQLVEEATMVYTYNEEAKVYVAKIGEDEYYAGTYSDYDTISASSISYITGDKAANVGVTQFVASYVDPTPGLEANTGYKYYVNQVNLGKVLYFAGTVTSAEYLATTEDITAAVDVYVEAVEDGVRFYFMKDEVKTYIEIYKNSAGKIRLQLVTEPTMVYTYNEEAKVYVATIDGTEYYTGTYGTYDTFSASKVSYITGDKAEDVGVSQFVASYVDPTPGLEVGTAYKYFLEQVKLGKTLYFAGTVNNSGFLTTTEDVETAVDVYVELTKDGVRFYFMKDEVKTYIEIFNNSENKIRHQLVTEPTMVYTYNEEAKVYVATIGEEQYYTGTYGTYNTFSASAVSYITGDNAANVGVSQFVAELKVPVIKEVEDITPGLAVDTPYKFYLEQANLNKVLYFKGSVNSSDYLETTEDINEAVDVYVEETAEGARFYFTKDGVKNYIEMFLNSNNKARLRIVTDPTVVFNYNEAAGVYTVDLDGTEYYAGTYSDYTTISASAVSYITGDKAANVGVSQFVAKFGKVSVSEVTEITAGVGYKYYLTQVNLNKVLCFKGTVSSAGYLETTEDVLAAADVFVEEVAEGGVRFYFMNGEVKTYIEIFNNSENKVRHQLVTEPTMVYTYNEEAKVYVATIGEDQYYTGTYGTFNTFSASKVSYITGDNAANVGVSQFVAKFGKPVITEAND